MVPTQMAPIERHGTARAVMMSMVWVNGVVVAARMMRLGKRWSRLVATPSVYQVVHRGRGWLFLGLGQTESD